MKARALLFVVLMPPMAVGYELQTHASISRAAIQASSIERDPAVLIELGLGEASQALLGTNYFDSMGSSAWIRSEDRFERRIIDQARPVVDPLSVTGWLMRGTIREDDLTTLGCAFGGVASIIHGNGVSGCNPQDDPYGDINRVLNHFYDPSGDRGLVYPGRDGAKAVDWALGFADSFATRPIPQATRRNHFSIVDARNAMYRALSGKGIDGSPAAEVARNAWWATVFRSLGSAMHLIQDMAQPQHTRNEAHAGSQLEDYIEARAAGRRRYHFGSARIDDLASLPLEGGSAPGVRRYDQLWSTATVDGFASGTGLADYSNRGFFTENATLNTATSRYVLPSRDRAAYDEKVVTDSRLVEPGSVVKLLMTRVPEYQVNGRGAYLVTETTFADFSSVGARYGFNWFNYDDQAELLIPRAVAYSAALLDHFFRGRIDLVKDPQLPGKYVIRNLGPDALSGRFTLYYDDVNNVRRPVMSAGNVPVEWKTEVILKGGSMVGDMPIEELGFAAPADAREPGVYMLVFNGDMGEEKAVGGDYVGAVAGKRVDLRPYLLVGVPRSTYSQEMYRSTDFGASWEYWGDQYDVCGSSFAEMRYIGNGVILGKCSVSRDGGRTWQTVAPLANNLMPTPTGSGNVLRFINPQDPPGTPPVDADRTFVQFSSDQGQTWSALAPTGFWGGDSSDGPINVDDGVLVTHAGYPDPENSTCPPPFDSTSCHAINFLGRIFRSNDRGVTWAPIATPTGWYSNMVAGLYLGRLSRTGSGLTPAPDGDKTIMTWTQIRIGPDLWHNVLQRSFDFGATWEPAGTPPDMVEHADPYFHLLRSLAYAGGGNVFAYFADMGLAGHRYLYRSRDYATTWERVGPMPPGSDKYPGAVSVIFVGDNGTISDIR